MNKEKNLEEEIDCLEEAIDKEKNLDKEMDKEKNLEKEGMDEEEATEQPKVGYIVSDLTTSVTKQLGNFRPYIHRSTEVFASRQHVLDSCCCIIVLH